MDRDSLHKPCRQNGFTFSRTPSVHPSKPLKELISTHLYRNFLVFIFLLNSNYAFFINPEKSVVRHHQNNENCRARNEEIIINKLSFINMEIIARNNCLFRNVYHCTWFKLECKKLFI